MSPDLSFEELPTHLVCRYTGSYRFPDIADAAHAVAADPQVHVLAAARGGEQLSRFALRKSPPPIPALPRCARGRVPGRAPVARRHNPSPLRCAEAAPRA